MISCNANSHQMTNHIFILSCEHRQVSKWNRIAATAKQHMIFILATKKGIDYCEDCQFQFSALQRMCLKHKENLDNILKIN